MTLTPNKRAYLEKLSRQGIISALAFDQRGALKRMMASHQTEEPTVEQMETLKVMVSEELTPYASSILLDPEYGIPAIKVKDEEAGLLLAYEKTGYDATTTSRLPDCLVEWSVKRIKEAGADAVKFLLYYDVDGDAQVNLQKQAYIERIGSECRAEDIPFFLEILTYDENITDNSSIAFAKVKAHKVNQAMRVFSADRFGIDVLKVEVPVNMAFVEGFADGEVLLSKEEAAQAFKEQEASSHLPYIYLSAGVSAKLFQETLVFAAESGAKFNGVLCGRATWSGSVPVYIKKGEEAARQWLRTEGLKNIEELNRVLKQTAIPWTDKI
ncbi:tagatose-bisphosphate aldolase [Streptococcus penaeicida]|uniref:Tagatose 1,6-diphosphate aldolase n=1 Tax=Streptococcus penaeicida TaxID=1765960 RepID=A0A2N8LE78_9STRE|nr:tagatose-bisphosphate aldolase [Streptococcus penaeicida]PND48445.1 tagatose-bisphosphate aldolase [Streptococcus penaeicida]